MHNLLFTLILCFCGVNNSQNIVFVFLDDLGFSDVGYHNSEFNTPNIDNLANEGLKLENYYAQPMCTPTRASFMTGMYPIRYGLQHYVIGGPRPFGLPTNLTILPELLLRNGYRTHMAGKWHLGMHTLSSLPLQRGFETFLGVFNGFTDHFEHTFRGMYDLHEGNERADKSYLRRHTDEIYTERAVQILRRHEQSQEAIQGEKQPLFLYISYQNPHAPLQPTPEYSERCQEIEDPNRRNFCGLVLMIDDYLQELVDTLHDLDMWEDTLLVVSSDNGGCPTYSGYNVPYRGDKGSVWEGGVRAVGFVTGGLLPPEAHQSTYEGLFHTSDWFPTLLDVAQIDIPLGLDGVSQWSFLTDRSRHDMSPRMEILLNHDVVKQLPHEHFGESGSGIIVGDYKLLWNSNWRPVYNIPGRPSALEIDRNVELLCTDIDGKTQCQLDNSQRNDDKIRLFNLKKDPTESINLAETEPKKVRQLLGRLYHFDSQSVPISNELDDIHGFEKAELNGNVWVPWIDDEQK